MGKNSVDFVIGGKDNAKPAMSSVEKSLERIEKKAEAAKEASSRLAMVTGVLAAAYAGVKAALAALGGIDKINAAYDLQTANVKKLTNVLKIRGDASGDVSKAMQAEAAAIQKLTGVGDELTLGYMHQATQMGFATDRVDDAVKAAIGLAEATGTDVTTSLGNLKEALQGNFQSFHALNPQIMFMRSNSEKMAAVMQIVNQGLDSSSKNMLTVAGSGQRASGAIGDLMEVVGAIFAPIRVLINAGLQKLAESLQTVLAPAAAFATSVLENIGPIIEWVQAKVVQAVNVMIGAFTFFETILMNFGDVWELVKAYAESAMLSIAGFIKHALTVVIPEYAVWFGMNFINLFRDAFNAVFAVIQNAGKIIGDMVYQIFAFIASGGEGGIDALMAGLGEAASRSLVDGFKSSLTPLPEIAERQLTAREKDLADKIGAIGGRLGKEFSDKMEERMLGVGGSLSEELNKSASNVDLKARKAMITQSLQVTEGRLLTRGPGSQIPDKLDQIIRLMQKPPQAPRILVENSNEQIRKLQKIQDNTVGKLQLEAIV